MKLPDEFLDKMKTLLNEEEYERFILSYDVNRYYGIRVNTLKISIEQFKKISPFKLEKIPWVKDGFYYNEGETPGKHPYYHAGLYYIQEPSAMLPAEILDARPGEYILDLCAAPGGKSVQIASRMRGEGLLVANDSNPERVKALVKNIELLGIRNAIVTNELPENLAAKFPEYFDKILVDAPCSGEGMFRKDENAARSWRKYKCEDCAKIQKNILEHANKMLKPGGRLVYSTCTFSPEENEKVILDFLKKNEDYNIIEIPLSEGIERGRPEWADGDERLCGTARLWPHKIKGEGHFVALLLKKGSSDRWDRWKKTEARLNEFNISKEKMEIINEFMINNLNMEIKGNLFIIGNNLYYLPVPLPELEGIKAAKLGWYLGRFLTTSNDQGSKVLKGRKSSGNLKNLKNLKNMVVTKGLMDMFEPSHSMVMALRKSDLKSVIDFNSKSIEVIKYLKGETLLIGGEKGLTGICIDGFTAGWAKQTGNMLKNLYPKGWRKIRE